MLSVFTMPFLGLLIFFPVALLIGAGVIWLRTKRLPVLIQLISSGLLVAMISLEALARYMYDHEKTGPWQFLRWSSVELVEQIVVIIALVGFPAGYLWHAFTEKR